MACFHPSSKASIRVCLRRELKIEEGRRSKSAIPKGSFLLSGRGQELLLEEKLRGGACRAWGGYLQGVGGKRLRGRVEHSLDQVLWLLKSRAQGTDHFGVLWARGRG